jgi:hypothetical protein
MSKLFNLTVSGAAQHHYIMLHEAVTEADILQLGL